MDGRSWLIAGIILVLGAGAAWFVAYDAVHRRTALEVPIRLEEGLTLTQKFNVHVAAEHWFAIRYNKDFRSTAEKPLPDDDFLAEFSVRLGRTIAAQGHNSNEDWPPRAAMSSGVHYTRLLLRFPARTNQAYELFFRVNEMVPSGRSAPALAMIIVDPDFDKGAGFRAFVFGWSAIVVFLFGVFFIVQSLQEARRAKGFSI
jgi:hypothetical protein